MNYQEIISKIRAYCEENDISFSEFAEGEFEPTVVGVGHMKQVHSTGGCDKGSDWSIVYHFTQHDVYIKVSGYYSSYSGVEFDEEWDGDVQEVTPREKVITVYE